MLKLQSSKNYENYRWFFTSSDNLVIGGKSDEQNELVLKNFLRPEYTILHTSNPGSPFMIIQSENPDKDDIEESAIFCACFSKQWKEVKPNKKIEVDVFKGDQVYKTKSMKTGTFGIKGDKKILKVVPKLVLVFQKGKLKSVPRTKKEKPLVEIKPGKLTKEKAAELIAKKIKDKFHFPISKEEIRSAIPSNKIGVK